MNLDITQTRFWTTHKTYIAAFVAAIFTIIGCVGVVTSAAQYAVRHYPVDADIRMWIVVAAFVGYMAIFVYTSKIMERFMIELTGIK